MDAKSVPRPTPQDLSTERLLAAVQSAIGGIQERLPDLAADTQDAKWLVSDGDAKASRATGARLLQLRHQLQGERPRTIFACWVDGLVDAPRDLPSSNHNNNDQPEPRNQRK